MDKFTGAQEAAPQVVVNVGYDPLQQFREVIQEEIQVIDIEAEPADADSDEQDDSDTD